MENFIKEMKILKMNLIEIPEMKNVTLWSELI